MASSVEWADRNVREKRKEERSYSEGFDNEILGRTASLGEINSDIGDELQYGLVH